MTSEQLILALFGAGLTAIGWFCRQMWDNMQTLKRELSDLELRISRDYVSYTRLTDAMKPVLDALQEIKEGLKTKADRATCELRDHHMVEMINKRP